jgi:hypothetical protein
MPIASRPPPFTVQAYVLPPVTWARTKVLVGPSVRLSVNVTADGETPKTPAMEDVIRSFDIISLWQADRLRSAPKPARARTVKRMNISHIMCKL